MSSTLGTFSEGFLDRKMCSEFQFWIKDDLKSRLTEYMGYQMTEALFDDICTCLDNHTNRDYLTCSKSLTHDLENLFKRHGIKEHDAIRAAWKWSD